MEEILETVMQKLAQIPELRWIDLNVGQMSVQNPPVDYPCALVDITAIDHTTAGVQRQIGDLQLEIELYFIVRSPANTLAPGRTLRHRPKNIRHPPEPLRRKFHRTHTRPHYP